MPELRAVPARWTPPWSTARKRRTARRSPGIRAPPRAVAGFRGGPPHEMRGGRHRLHAAGDHDLVLVAGPDGLVSPGRSRLSPERHTLLMVMDGTLIEIPADTEACRAGDPPCRRLHDVPQDHLVHLTPLDPRPLDGCRRRGAPELRSGEVRQRAEELAHRGFWRPPRAPNRSRGPLASRRGDGRPFRVGGARCPPPTRPPGPTADQERLRSGRELPGIDHVGLAVRTSTPRSPSTRRPSACAASTTR